MRFIPFPASILSTKNAHKFCTFLLFAFTKLVSHMSSCFLSLFYMVLTCYNPCSYPIWLHFSAPVYHTSKNALETFSLLFPLFECKLAPFGCRARVRGWLFSFFILICALSISYNLFACLFFDSTNSERCFAVLRANTNYNFLIYGNDFTQIQEIRSHCRRRRLF